MGRSYSTVAPGFWTGRTGRQIRAMGQAAQLVALYLITCPGASGTGVYYLPLPTLAHETNCSLEEARCILQALERVDFARYDESEEMVWVVNMAREQIDEVVKVGDNRWKWLVKEIESFRSSRFFEPFMRRYYDAFQLGSAFEGTFVKGEVSKEAPSKPLPSPSEEASGKPEEPQEAPSKPRAGAGARAGTASGTAAAAGAGTAPAPETAPAAAAPAWMVAELKEIGLACGQIEDLWRRLGLDGLRGALAKLRSKDSKKPAGLLLSHAEDLAQEGTAMLEKNLKRALAQVPENPADTGWGSLPADVRDDPEVAAAWAVLQAALSREAAASEDGLFDARAVSDRAEGLFRELMVARHPDAVDLVQVVEAAARDAPERLRHLYRRSALLKFLGLVPLKPASGGV